MGQKLFQRKLVLLAVLKVLRDRYFAADYWSVRRIRDGIGSQNHRAGKDERRGEEAKRRRGEEAKSGRGEEWKLEPSRWEKRSGRGQNGFGWVGLHIARKLIFVHGVRFAALLGIGQGSVLELGFVNVKWYLAK
jgi:hypothetical protein